MKKVCFTGEDESNLNPLILEVYYETKCHYCTTLLNSQGFHKIEELAKSIKSFKVDKIISDDVDDPDDPRYFKGYPVFRVLKDGKEVYKKRGIFKMNDPIHPELLDLIRSQLQISSF